MLMGVFQLFNKMDVGLEFIIFTSYATYMQHFNALKTITKYCTKTELCVLLYVTWIGTKHGTMLPND